VVSSFAKNEGPGADSKCRLLFPQKHNNIIGGFVSVRPQITQTRLRSTVLLPETLNISKGNISVLVSHK